MSEGLTFCIISDFFIDDFIGGAALNDEQIFLEFEKSGKNAIKIKSKDLSLEKIKEIKDYKLIISNFFHLEDEVKNYIQNNCDYVLYVHDYKFVQHTNPAIYKDFEVPKDELINVDFHNNSKAIICQSSFQKRIYDLNLDSHKLTKNFSGNLWDDRCFEIFSEYLEYPKNNKVAVVKSNLPQKGTPESIKLCIDNRLDYDLVYDDDYYSFIKKLGLFSAIAFVPFTPETLSRVCVEGKMMGLEVYTTNLVGATYEPWFNKKGQDMIDEMKNRRASVVDFICNQF
tara:strand:- start:3886 stop:4737 length:852 start_codon:yes stop_codon:yes gene_type:complete